GEARRAVTRVADPAGVDHLVAARAVAERQQFAQPAAERRRVAPRMAVRRRAAQREDAEGSRRLARGEALQVEVRELHRIRFVNLGAVRRRPLDEERLSRGESEVRILRDRERSHAADVQNAFEQREEKNEAARGKQKICGQSVPAAGSRFGGGGFGPPGLFRSHAYLRPPVTGNGNVPSGTANTGLVTIRNNLKNGLFGAWLLVLRNRRKSLLNNLFHQFSTVKGNAKNSIK